MTTHPLIDHASSAPDVPRWSETLRDRSGVLIRPIQPQDRAAEAMFIESLSQQARRYRFLGQVSSPSEETLDQLVDVDFVHDVAFVAVVKEDAHERIVGVARYSVDPDGAACEIAVTVANDWQGRGLGTILMRHLIDVARARGIRAMYSLDATDNVDMTDLARHLGFRTKLHPKTLACTSIDWSCRRTTRRRCRSLRCLRATTLGAAGLRARRHGTAALS